MATMRDVFWKRVYEFAKEDRNIVVLSADFAAPALDKFRLELPAQYIHTGISEQNTILLATGLALSGKKVFCTAIAPFITMRCFEQIRLYPAGMNLPITIVGVGAGVCYEDSGPTHHAVEDIRILRGLPHMKIFSAADNIATRAFADLSINLDSPNYVRLDRMTLPDVHQVNSDFSSGIVEIKPKQKINILATGCTLNNAVAVAERLASENISIGVMDACIFPFANEVFVNKFEDTDILITLEEHVLSGGLGSHICELVMDCELDIKVKRMGFDFSDGYCCSYGGRAAIQEKYGFDTESIIDKIKELV